MNQVKTTAIVISRINYGEADRIITVITPDHGKKTLMAKGVRRVKSKLAGGIELFGVNELVFMPGRGSMSRLISARLCVHYGRIAADISRTMLGYELIRLLAKVTEEAAEAEYFGLLEQTLAMLDDLAVDERIIRVWFDAQLLRLAGHTPNLTRLSDGTPLSVDKCYAFDFERVGLRPAADDTGSLDAATIKYMRLLFGLRSARVITKIKDGTLYAQRLMIIVSQLRQLHLSN